MNLEMEKLDQALREMELAVDKRLNPPSVFDEALSNVAAIALRVRQFFVPR